jgi:hypothetical protein
MTRYVNVPASDRHYLVPEGVDVPVGPDPAALAPYEVSREAAAAHLRGQVSGLVDLLAAAVEPGDDTRAGPERLAALLGTAAADLPELGAALRGLADDVLSMGDPAAASARIGARGSAIGAALRRQMDQLRILEPVPDGSTRELGRRLDSLVGRLEGAAGAREKERRAEEYRRGARSAIADSLREAGFTPLPEARGTDGTQ